MTSTQKIRVLIVDDSASVRQALKDLLESDPQLEVIGTASDPFAAAEFLKRDVPDVMTLDVEMPRMDGLTFLEKLMGQHPIPVVICSSLTESGSRTAIAALELGAVEVICKPSLGTPRQWSESAIHICDAVRSAARARPKSRPSARRSVQVPGPKLTADAMLSLRRGTSLLQTTEKVVAIGASTGGTEAISTVLSALPVDSPGIVIVQHMPEKFTAHFADRLNSYCPIAVREARPGDTVQRGQALVAPGGKHLMLKRSGARYYVDVADGPLVNRHRPSVDVMFRSVARYAGPNAIGVILTGMGDDGAQGLFELHQAGGYTIGQDEATSVVYGMPQEAMKRGGVRLQLGLDDIAAAILTVARTGEGPRGLGSHAITDRRGHVADAMR